MYTKGTNNSKNANQSLKILRNESCLGIDIIYSFSTWFWQLVHKPFLSEIKTNSHTNASRQSFKKISLLKFYTYNTIQRTVFIVAACITLLLLHPPLFPVENFVLLFGLRDDLRIYFPNTTIWKPPIFNWFYTVILAITRKGRIKSHGKNSSAFCVIFLVKQK